MIKKYSYGVPFETYATVRKLEAEKGRIPYFAVEKKENGLVFSVPLDKDDAIYGLGENVRGINKRGFIYQSDNRDDSPETEGKHALYGAYNFMVFKGEKKCFGVFFDDPGEMLFDLGYTDPEEAVITSRFGDLEVFIIDGNDVKAVIREFRGLIGRSYLAPKWAFGYIQSRFGDVSEKEIEKTLAEYEKIGMPVDSFCIDIDGLENFQNFSWNRENFKDPAAFTRSLLDRGIHLIPIVDVAIRQDKEIKEYASGEEIRAFCSGESGEEFTAYVWPGSCVFPDYFREDVRKWFGHCYQDYLNMGIHGFWNDMNEPSIFATQKGFRELADIAKQTAEKYHFLGFARLKGVDSILYDPKRDNGNFMHDIDGRKVPNERVHNIYGAMMSQATDAGFREYDPDLRCTLFTRSSAIGAHRYTGVWLGDNSSWWSHLLQNLKWLPSMNMCGYLYTGADLGGFKENTSDELMLRWLQLGIFVPIMRNHSEFGTRHQEIYHFTYKEAMARIVQLRYSLFPYIYSEYMKAALRDECMFKPLAFDYPDDRRAIQVEDQLMLGDEVMIAPVYTQNSLGRYVYLPEDMLMIRTRGVDDIEEVKLEKGDHWIDLDTDQLAFFIKKDRAIPFADTADRIARVDYGTIRMLGWVEKPYTYELYDDDGLSRTVSLDSIRKITVK